MARCPTCGRGFGYAFVFWAVKRRVSTCPWCGARLVEDPTRKVVIVATALLSALVFSIITVLCWPRIARELWPPAFGLVALFGVTVVLEPLFARFRPAPAARRQTLKDVLKDFEETRSGTTAP